MSTVANIYDALLSFESKKNRGVYPIHKNIEKDDKSLLECIVDKIEILDGMRVLDAGCGTGNTLFYLHEKHKISGVGISVSGGEVEFANSQIRKKGASDISFQERNFTSSLDDLGQFDLIFCIESLKHSIDLEKAINNLSKRLADKGTLIIADDFLINQNEPDSEIRTHKELWSAPGFVSIDTIKKILSVTFMSEPVVDDYSKFVPLKNGLIRRIILTFLKVYVRILKRGSMLRTNVNTYIGALLLESLYVKRNVGYYIIRIQKGNV